jgi:hypothetical protein
MTDSVRRLKINKRYESIACAWCGDALTVGEDGAVCEACESPHHARCWDKENGCGQRVCINAPLRQDPDPPILDEQLSANEMRCPHCGKLLPARTTRCSGCQRFTTPSGLYEGELKTAPLAREAFLLSLVAVFVPPILNIMFYAGNIRAGGIIPLIIGLRCGWSARKKAEVAKSQIANDQTLKGRGLAIAAQILGGIALALPVLGIVFVILLIASGGL